MPCDGCDDKCGCFDGTMEKAFPVEGEYFVSRAPVVSATTDAPVPESEQTKRLAAKDESSGLVPCTLEQLELSRRLDALEARR